MGSNLSHIGEWAALATACCWTITALSFEKASKRVGSLPVNWIRLVLAFFLLSLYSWIFRGTPWPADATAHLWTWLSISGLIGFVLGDLFLFRAFVEIGSRISMLIMASVPVMTALLGWIFMQEHLSRLDILAMMITLSGIALVVLEQNRETRQVAFTHPLRGVLLAFGGAAGQAVGLILSKYGMGDYNPFQATQIRVMTGILGFSLLFFPMKRWGRVRDALRNKTAMFSVSLGAFFGPFLGVSLSLLAIQKTMTGIASTIMAIVPILLIPPAVILFHERVTLKEIAGAFLAVGGVAILFLEF
ncbi:DMT family transporter [bacterium]|nr:DMT family transporter [bacterium]